MKKKCYLIKEIEQAMKNGSLLGFKTVTRQQGSSLTLRMTKTVIFEAKYSVANSTTNPIRSLLSTR